MALVATAPVVLESRTDAWLIAPAASAKATAWLRLPEDAGSLRLVTARVGDQLAVRLGKATRTVVDGGCPTSGECQGVRALAAGATDAFAAATAPDDETRLLMSAAPGRRLRVLAAGAPPDDPTARDESRLASAGGGQAIWLADGSIMTRPLDGSAPARRLLRPENTRGTVIALAVSDTAFAWTARAEDGAYSVVSRPLVDGKGAVLLAESRKGVALGALALLGDGSVAVARRYAGRRIVDEVVRLVPGQGGAAATATSLIASVSVTRTRPVDLVRPEASGSIVVVRVRDGLNGLGLKDAIWAIDVATGDRLRLARESRGVMRLSDPSISGRRVVWARTRIDGTELVRSRIQAVRLRG